ncbi:hypothetical protein IT570_05355 [Candidatus Sumerlaeota bacterium]|nr:hypothetical protein [Candidatus Sumerlaeota bacterium]
MRRSDKRKFPGWGYVTLNVAFTALMVAVYFASLSYAKHNNFRSAGIFPVLLVCWLSFIFVSFCDWLFERISNRPKNSFLDREFGGKPQRTSEDPYKNDE